MGNFQIPLSFIALFSSCITCRLILKPDPNLQTNPSNTTFNKEDEFQGSVQIKDLISPDMCISINDLQ